MRRLFVYSLGLLFNRPLQAVLSANGYRITWGLPLRRNDAVAVWGQRPTAKRGHFMARIFGRDLITLEDAFLRSIKPGRDGDPPIGIILDRSGIYYDPAAPNDLSARIAEVSGETAVGAFGALELLKVLKVSKYNNHTVGVPSALPERFALVIDQVLGDASIAGAGADAETFQRMLEAALSDDPNRVVVIKSHPEHLSKHRKAYLAEFVHDRVVHLTTPVSPWDLLERADDVYTVSSLFGLEAIFAGHRPHVFGAAFYAGLGLTRDRGGQPMRGNVTPEQLYDAAYQKYALYRDPATGRSTVALGAALSLAAQRRVAQLPKQVVFAHMRLWKRPFLAAYFKDHSAGFAINWDEAVKEAKRIGAPIAAWASKITEQDRGSAAMEGIKVCAVEDGFLRSAGLGAELVRPFSLCLDWQGIYYDPSQSSDCERLIAASLSLPAASLARAARLRERIVAAGATKYNLNDRSEAPSVPTDREVILVPEQVEDDASVLTGSRQIKTNEDLLKAVRTDYPNAYVLFKRHPDVVAGLRTGAGKEVVKLADKVVEVGDPAEMLPHCGRVATISSLMGFEALLRGIPVTCYGTPFYAGWGLTDDRSFVPKRRAARPTLDQLTHAVLIDYPYYWDPVTAVPCPPETILERIERGEMGRKGGPFNRILSKLQGIFASLGPFWR